MKKITRRKISYSIGITAITAINILIHITYANITPKDNTIDTLLVLVSIASLVIIGIYLSEIVKSSDKVKKENIQSFNNRINYHKNIIDQYNKLIEQTEKDY